MSTNPPSKDPKGTFRHEPRSKAFTPAFGDPEAIDAISDHIERHVGPIEMVFHEIISDLVHLDVHHIKPSVRLNANVLVTSGVSDLPMTVPDGYPGPRHLELCVFLPPDWRMPDKSDEANGEAALERLYWPVRWLKNLGRLPHEYETFLGYGHTVPNGDPPEPFADNVKFCCMFVTFPYPLSPEFAELTLPDREVCFMQLIPLFEEEMNLKLRKDAEALEKAFERTNLDPLGMFNGARPNAAAKKLFGLF